MRVLKDAPQYVCNGLLFKVALADAPDDLFSGSDANAAKAAGQELKYGAAMGAVVVVWRLC